MPQMSPIMWEALSLSTLVFIVLISLILSFSSEKEIYVKNNSIRSSVVNNMIWLW